MNLVKTFYKCNLEINHMYIMMNDQRREFNRLSELENHTLNMRPLMKSKIEEINSELCEIGRRILEENITAERFDGIHELNQEK